MWDYWAAVFGDQDAEDVEREAKQSSKTLWAYVEESVAIASAQDAEGTFDTKEAVNDIMRQIQSVI